MRARPRPLLVRPGARFACAGDGLCCADAHLLGPISPTEARALRAISPESVVRVKRLVIVETKDDGTCVWYENDSGRCRIHETDAKPRTCHRFPFLLIATPDGGRIATDHRCPCRTMGERPPLAVELAESALRDRAGRLSVDHRAPEAIPIARGRTLGWSEWRAFESSLFERLDGGERVESVLETEPFPEIEDGTWAQIGLDLGDDERPMRWTRASQWAADAIADLHGAEPHEDRPRPWSIEFDRAERRSAPRDPEAMLADWIADSIWSLEWTGRADLALARADLASRTAIARWVAARLEARIGARRDRAMAEGIAVAEIVGLSDAWSSLLDRVVV